MQARKGINPWLQSYNCFPVKYSSANSASYLASAARIDFAKIHMSSFFRVLLGLRLASHKTATNHTLQGEVVDVGELVASSRFRC